MVARIDRFDHLVESRKYTLRSNFVRMYPFRELKNLQVVDYHVTAEKLWMAFIRHGGSLVDDEQLISFTNGLRERERDDFLHAQAFQPI